MKNKKSIIVLVFLFLLGTVGGTFSYFTSSTTVTNDFITGVYSTSATEEFISPDNWVPGSTAKNIVNVTNDGSSVDIVARIKYTGTWTAKDGTVLSGVRNGENVALFDIGTDWIKGTDGYYYYRYVLSDGETSSDFISSVTFNPNFELEPGTDIGCTTKVENGKTIVTCENLDSGYAGAKFVLDITVETIQADQAWEAYERRWYYAGTELPAISTVDADIEWKFAALGRAQGLYGLCLSTSYPLYDENQETIAWKGANVESYYVVVDGKWVLHHTDDFSYKTDDRWTLLMDLESVEWVNFDLLYRYSGEIFLEATEPVYVDGLIEFIDK